MIEDFGRRALVRHVLRSTVSNSIGTILNLGTWFLLTPFILSQLGATLYGLWILVGSVVAYGWLLDLGIAGAVTKYTAEYRAAGRPETARSLIATALWLYTGVGIVIFIASALFAPVFPRLFNVAPSEQSTAFWLVLLSGMGVGVMIPCATATAVLRGLQRFDLINLIGITATLLSAGATVVVLRWGGGPVGLVLVGIAVTLLAQVPSVWLIYRIAPELRFGWRGASRDQLRAVTSYSSSLFVMNLGGHLETKTDEIVIGAFLPISAVTPYNLARRLSMLPQTLTDQFLTLLLPMASEAHATDPPRLRSLYILSTRVTLAISLPAGLTLIILAPDVLSAWVGAAYADYAYLVWILVIAGLIDTSQWPAGSILQGMVRHRPLAVMTIGAGVANVGLSVLLVNRLGLMGVALGTLIPTTIVCLGFVTPYAMRVIGVRAADMYHQVLRPALVPAVPMGIVVYILRDVTHPSSIIVLLLVAAAGPPVYLAVYLGMGANELERDVCRSALASAVHRAKLRLKRV
jgi:O-antigen/teichoic acid export membrane protein